jgi:hypothetical protein
MHKISPLGESLGGLFIRVVKGSGKNVPTPPTTLFTQSVQSWGHYSHFTLLAALHGAYLVVTRVPFD